MVLIGWCGCRSALCFFSVSVSVDNFDYSYCLHSHKFYYSLIVYNNFLPHSFWLHLYCLHSHEFYYSLIVYNILYRTLFGCTSIVCTPMILVCGHTFLDMYGLLWFGNFGKKTPHHHPPSVATHKKKTKKEKSINQQAEGGRILLCIPSPLTHSSLFLALLTPTWPCGSLVTSSRWLFRQRPLFCRLFRRSFAPRGIRRAATMPHRCNPPQSRKWDKFQPNWRIFPFRL